ncbi:MAG TPA: hypothetical protein VFA46_21330 [Actinomycetes bacterium]|nr:hypothetical protein [Actinomycetes bacterium]
MNPGLEPTATVAAALGIGLALAGAPGPVQAVILAEDGLRSTLTADAHGPARIGLPPPLRGSLAVLLNPGAWLFLATVAAPLLSGAGRVGGLATALLTALALAAGAATGDTVLAVAGGIGLHRTGDRTRAWVQRALAVILAALGVWLLIAGLTS